MLAKDPMDQGFMYGRSFFDGRHWEVMWMSQEAVDAAGSDRAPEQLASA